MRGWGAGVSLAPHLREWLDGIEAHEHKREARGRPARWTRPLREVPVVGAVPMLEADWVRPDRWRAVVRGGFVFPDKIHVKEARAEVLGLRRAARNLSNHGTVLLSITDSLPAALSFEKGRSRDWALAAQVRIACAYVLGCSFHWRQR